MSSSSAAAGSSSENRPNNRRPLASGVDDGARKRAKKKDASVQEMMEDVLVDVKLTKDQKVMVRSVISKDVFGNNKNFATNKELKQKCPAIIASVFERMGMSTTSTTDCMNRRKYASAVMEALKSGLSEYRLKINRLIKSQNLGKLYIIDVCGLSDRH